VYGISVENFDAQGTEPSRFCYRFLSPDDEDLIRQVEAMAEWLVGQLRNRITGGALCLVATEDRQVACFNLVDPRQARMPILNASWPCEADQAWSEQISTHRNWRRQGLATQVRYRMMAELRRRGVKWLMGGTLINNVAALALARRVGFVELGDIRYRSVMGREEWLYEALEHEDDKQLPVLFGRWPAGLTKGH